MREKILRSLNTKDLSDEEWESASHVIAALGMAQKLVQQNPTPERRQELMSELNLPKPRKHLSIGAMLLHIKAGQARFLPRVIALTTSYVVSRAHRERWAGVTKDRANTIVRIALDRFFDHNCEVCHGVGRIGEVGQVIVLCSRSEGGCGGTGKKSENWRGWMERVKDVLSALESWEGYASGGAFKQAGRTRYRA
jgi:hypothetical protein